MIDTAVQRRTGPTTGLILLALTLGLAGCEEGTTLFAPKPEAETATETAEGTPAAPARSVRLVDRDVEAPEVFQVTDDALWDGRPSLGGVWVASPNATDPERVILRNPANGKFVIGALFRRERDNPGPTLQISSDAAEALGLLAGQTAKISVTALRREEAPVTAPDANAPILDAAETVETETLDIAAPTPAAAAAPAAPAAAKPDTAAAGRTPAMSAAAVNPVAAAATPPAAAGPASRIQIGIFSVEANARRAADTLTGAGITAQVKKEQGNGKTYWSVTASGGGDAAALLAKVKGLGFKDAYFLR